MYYQIKTRGMLEQVIEDPKKIRQGAELDAKKDPNNPVKYYHYEDPTKDMVFDYDEAPYYITTQYYNWQKSGYTWIIRDIIKTKEDLLNAIYNHTSQTFDIPGVILKDILCDHNRNYNLKQHRISSINDGTKINYEDINKETLHSLKMVFIAEASKFFNDLDYVFAKDFIDKYMDSKTKVSEIHHITCVISKYIKTFTDFEDRKKAFWFCVETMESKFKTKTSKRCRKFMAQIFANCISESFKSGYGEDETDEQDIVIADRDYYLLNMYFKHCADLWKCRTYIIQHLDNIKTFDDFDVTKLFYNVDSTTKDKIMARINGTTEKTDIDLLINRVHNGGSNSCCRAMTIEYIYSIVSKHELEEFKTMNIDLLAKALVEFRYYESWYSSLMPQTEILTKSENIDYIAEKMVDIIAEKKNIQSCIQQIMTQSPRDCYFYKSIKKAVENSEHKRIKRAIFKMNV